MTVKKIGVAKADPEAGSWIVEARSDQFIMNPRLVDLRADVKVLKSAYSRHSSKLPPSMRRAEVRKDYFQKQREIKAELQKLLAQVYQEILEESFSRPLLLRKDKDGEYGRAWRHCLYRGMIYQFDRSDYGADEMREQIETQNKGQIPFNDISRR